MRKGKEATSEQLEKIWNIAAESEIGSFGMPTDIRGASSDLETHVYELIEVVTLGAREVDDCTGRPRRHLSTRNRIFRPALETALGFGHQEPSGNALGLQLSEARLREAQAMVPHLTPDPNLTSDRPIASDEHIPESQTYESVYAAMVGKFATRVSLESRVFDVPGSEKLQKSYRLVYALKNKQPVANTWNVLRPLHTHYLELTQLDSGQIRPQFFRDRSPIPVPFQTHFRVPLAEEVDSINADLEQIKEDYRRWTLV